MFEYIHSFYAMLCDSGPVDHNTTILFIGGLENSKACEQFT